MSSQRKIAVLLCLSGSAAHAEQTIINLNQAAQTILDQLELSQTLTAGALYYAGTGGVIEAGTMQTASITDQMQNDLNGAISAVTAATYYDSHQLLLDEYDATMVQLDSAVDNLVDATLVLMTVSTLADMAAQADTVQEQLAFQNLLENSPEMQITDTEQGAYNNALASVQDLAREAGAFLAAANNSFVTSTTDAYAAQAGISLYGGGAVYSATADILSITGESAFGLGFNGFLQSAQVSVDDVYDAGYGS